MADQDPPSLRGDEAELFRAYNDDLMRLVTRSCRTTQDIAEDACAFAWAQFLQHQPDRDRNWHGWLFRVAQREVWTIERRMRSATHIAGMEPDGTRFGVREPADRRDALTTRADLDEAVELLKRMPPRLKRIAFLRAIGLEYREISEVTGDSPRRVGQLVAAANQHIYEERARRAAERGELAPRAKRLADLEGNPPAWLSERIGRAPSMLNRRVPRATELLAWRRAALALDDYRRDHAPGGDGSRLGSVPDSSAGRRAWGAVLGAIRRLEAQRDVHRGRERER